jgi:transposase
MAKELVSDERWAVLRPLLPPPKPKPKGDRPPIPGQKVLAGILFVPGAPWEILPRERGSGSGMTYGRRLRAWPQAGVRPEIRLSPVFLSDGGMATAYPFTCTPRGSGFSPPFPLPPADEGQASALSAEGLKRGRMFDCADVPLRFRAHPSEQSPVGPACARAHRRYSIARFLSRPFLQRFGHG